MTFRHRYRRAAAAVRGATGSCRGWSAQFTIFLHNSQQIESPSDQRLKMTAIKLQIFRRIDAGLLCFAQWLRARDAQGDDQDLGPVFLNLVDQIAAFSCTQIDEEKDGPGLLQDGVEPVWIGDVAHVAPSCAKTLLLA